MSITLPQYHHRRAWLRGFWITVSIVVGSAIATSFVGLGSPNAIWYGAGSAFLLATVGFAQPDLARLPYRAFNAIARRFSALAARYFSALCYYVVLVPVALVARLGPSSEGQAGWASPTLRPIDAEGTQDGAGAMARFCSAVVRSEPWMLSLVPFILLQRLVSERRRDAEPLATDTYTLY